MPNIFVLFYFISIMNKTNIIGSDDLEIVSPQNHSVHKIYLHVLRIIEPQIKEKNIENKQID